MAQNGESEPQAEWADGEKFQWDKCPQCGCEDSLWSRAAKGEVVSSPPGMVFMPLSFIMPINGAIIQKQVIVGADMCPECGTLYARIAVKQRVQQGPKLVKGK